MGSRYRHPCRTMNRYELLESRRQAGFCLLGMNLELMEFVVVLLFEAVTYLHVPPESAYVTVI